jgi:hypothetical protein
MSFYPSSLVGLIIGSVPRQYGDKVGSPATPNHDGTATAGVNPYHLLEKGSYGWRSHCGTGSTLANPIQDCVLDYTQLSLRD